MNPKNLWRALCARMGLIASVCLLAIGLAAVVSASVTPTYSSGVRMIVNDFDEFYEDDIMQMVHKDERDRFVASQLALLKSAEILEPTVNHLHLRAIYANRERVDFLSARDALMILSSRVAVGKDPYSDLLCLTAVDADPFLAARIVDYMAHVYMERRIEARSRWEDGRRANLEEQPGKSEAAVIPDQSQRDAVPVKREVSPESIISDESTARGKNESLEAARHDLTNQMRLRDSLRSRVYQLEPAVPSVRPAAPNWTLNLVLGGAFGLVVGVGLAFLLTYLDQIDLRTDDLEPGS